MSRRRVLEAAGAGLVVAAGVGLLVRPASATPEATREAIKRLIGDLKPRSGRIALKLPQVAEDGGTVPLKVIVESPMTADDYVRAIHVLAEHNPNPEVVSFHLGPRAGKAEIATRIRLARSQDVIAVAEMSDGSVWMTAVAITVTVGGCGV